jgi:hypothetical protein
MSKFTFVCQEESMPFVHSIQSKRTVEFNAETLDDILNEFEMFLRGAGFHFEGHLDFVNEDDFIQFENEEDGLEESKQRWNATVHSLMNPPKFRANATTCEVCGLNKEMMATHHCYDDNCPVHAPQSVCKSEE